MQHVPLQIPPEPAPENFDRRSYPRQKLRSVAYVDFGPGNGGLVLNLSESGLALSLAMEFVGGQLPQFSFRLPGQDHAIEVRGQLVWTGKSRKELGVRFLQLRNREAAGIRDWLAAERRSLFSEDASEPVKPQTPQASDPFARLESIGTSPSDPSLESVLSLPLPSPLREPVPPVARSRRFSTIFSLAAIFLAFLAGLIVERRLQPSLTPQPSAPDARNAGDSQDPAHSQQASPRSEPQTPGSEQASSSNQALGSPEANAVNRKGGSARDPGSDAAIEKDGNNKEPGASGSDAGPLTKAPAAKNSEVSPGPSGARRNASSPRANAPSSSKAASATASKLSSDSSLRTARGRARETAAEHPATAPAPEPSDLRSTISPETSANSAVSGPPAGAASAGSVPTGSVSIQAPPFPSMRIPPEMKSQLSSTGQKLQMGQAISKIQPVYPREAISERMEGNVKARLTIGASGMVESVQADGPALLAESASSALRQWKFRPTLLNGTPIGAEMEVVVVFQLLPNTR